MTQKALKLALEALETELSIDWTNNDEFNASAEKMYEAIAAIKEALAQPEQEPVVVCCQQYDTCLKPCTPRGRHLAQRTWVGLKDEEIDQGLLRSNHALQTAVAWRDGVEWAIKQLKEKNT